MEINKPLKQLLLKWSLIILFIAVFLLCVWYFFKKINDSSPNRDNAKLIEAQKIAQETPVRSDFKLLSSSETSFAHAAGVSQRYLAPVPCAEIRKYYEKILTERDWVLVYEEKSTPIFSDSHRYISDFKHGDFSIVLEYGESKENKEADCNFILDFNWSDKGFGLNQ